MSYSLFTSFHSNLIVVFLKKHILQCMALSFKHISQCMPLSFNWPNMLRLCCCDRKEEKKLISSVEGQVCCHKGNELLWWKDVDSNSRGPAWYVGVGDRALGKWGWG